MPTPTYTPLATVTLGSNTASVTFGSIPATYRDLIITFNGSMAGTGTSSVCFRYNSDSGSNYVTIYMVGTGSSAVSGASSTTLGALVGFYASHATGQRHQGIMHIMDYSATDKHKTALIRDDSPSTETEAQANRWANTAAINNVQIFANFSGLLASGSTINLYGIAS
jgi:hypothetical protein